MLTPLFTPMHTPQFCVFHLSVPPTDVEHNRVVCTGYHPPHLDMRHTVVNRNDGLAPQLTRSTTPEAHVLSSGLIYGIHLESAFFSRTLCRIEFLVFSFPAFTDSYDSALLLLM